jgi:hypothetical protein
MTQFVDKLRRNPKLIVSALLPAVLLIVLVLATGTGDLFGGGGSSAPPSGSGTSGAPPPPSGTKEAVHGQVSVAAIHLSGHLWRFTYTIHDVGKTPIGGFQLNGPSANLSLVNGRAGWAIFGAGVCHGKFPNMLVYWSTGPGSATEIKPSDTVRFSFEVNTMGTSKRLYSLSWGQAGAQFAEITGPAPSNFPASGRCKA